MKQDKRIHRLAKKLTEFAKDERGMVTSERVTEVLEGLRKAKHRHHLLLLRTFQKLIRRAVSEQTAQVQTATQLSDEAVSGLEQKFSNLYGRPIIAEVSINPTLIGGVRVRVGDDVYDETVAGRLERLSASVR